MVLRQNNIYFELFDKYCDYFAVNFACNFTYIFVSVVYKLISLTVRLGCLWWGVVMFYVVTSVSVLYLQLLLYH